MKTKEKITLTLLCLVYGLVSLRVFPGRLVDSTVATLNHLLSAVPITIGLTIFCVSILQKMVGVKLPYDRIARIYLAFGLIAEFFYAVIDYTSRG
ncbi:MAG: hypothetical protein JRJ14_02750 [Deltaproteobacteria bacterium]|jgi:hypothetical protein|nr:hypothetical protein [Deltaproteobacteria bacterium]NOR11619.1 hypothetical protein [Desulfovibrionaceae bacterium]